MGWILAFAVLAGLAALPIWLENRRDPVGEAQRRAAPGGFAALSGGVTHYRWQGPEGGRVAVLVHGLTTSSYVFQALVPELQVQGFRCLSYDLYGRGLSDRPGGAQTRSLFVIQLRELLEELAVGGPVTLIGYSMGGAIATVYAAEEPERVAGLVLLAPAGLRHRPDPFAEFCRRVPYLGDWVHTVFGGIRLRRAAAGDSAVPGLAARQQAETRTRGYLRAVLSSRRHLLAERLEEEHAALAEMRVPVLAVWGGADEVIPLTALGELTRLNRDARQVVVEAAGHGLPQTHPREVAQAIREFSREL